MNSSFVTSSRNNTTFELFVEAFVPSISTKFPFFYYCCAFCLSSSPAWHPPVSWFTPHLINSPNVLPHSAHGALSHEYITAHVLSSSSSSVSSSSPFEPTQWCSRKDSSLHCDPESQEWPSHTEPVTATGRTKHICFLLTRRNRKYNFFRRKDRLVSK